MVGKADGVPKDSFRHIFGALGARASDHALHREHRRIRAHRLTHFETVVVGGSGGRSPYNAHTYLKSIPLRVRQVAASGRAPQPYDDEYAHDEKAGAHSHYMSHLMRFLGAPAAGSAARPPRRANARSRGGSSSCSTARRSRTGA